MSVVLNIHCANALCKSVNSHQNLPSFVMLYVCNSPFVATQMINLGLGDLFFKSILEAISLSTVWFICKFIYCKNTMRSINYCAYQWPPYLLQPYNFSPKTKIQPCQSLQWLLVAFAHRLNSKSIVWLHLMEAPFYFPSTSLWEKLIYLKLILQHTINVPHTEFLFHL